MHNIKKDEYDRLLKKYIAEQAKAYPEKQAHGFFGKWAEYVIRKKEFDKLLRAGVITVE
jgi:hypothetical protein